MGLFRSKNNEEVTAKITDFFTMEDIAKIKELVSPKRAANKYGKYTDLVDGLLVAVNHVEKNYSKKELAAILYSVGGMTKIEPSLNHVFNPAIEKMHAFRKK